MNRKQPVTAIKPGDIVLIRTKGSAQRKTAGRVISISGSTAAVQPFPRHPRLEHIDLKYPKYWKKGNALTSH